MGKLDVVEVQNYNSRGLISFLEPGSLQLQYRCVKERKKLASPKKKFFYPGRLFDHLLIFEDIFRRQKLSLLFLDYLILILSFTLWAQFTEGTYV